MELFILTVLKIVVVFIAIGFARGAVESVREGKIKNHPAAWMMMLVGSFIGFAFICQACEVDPIKWLPQMLAVMFVQSLAYLWWRATMPPPVKTQDANLTANS